MFLYNLLMIIPILAIGLFGRRKLRLYDQLFPRSGWFGNNWSCVGDQLSSWIQVRLRFLHDDEDDPRHSFGSHPTLLTEEKADCNDASGGIHLEVHGHDLFTDQDGKRHARNRRKVVNAYSVTELVEMGLSSINVVLFLAERLEEFVDRKEVFDLGGDGRERIDFGSYYISTVL